MTSLKRERQNLQVDESTTKTLTVVEVVVEEEDVVRQAIKGTSKVPSNVAIATKLGIRMSIAGLNQKMSRNMRSLLKSRKRKATCLW